MRYQIAYWCNLNLRDKYFDGYKPTDDLVYVGTIEATGPEDAYKAFNRIDEAHAKCAGNQVLDEAEAPSMSVGDVIQVVASSRLDVNGNRTSWMSTVDEDGRGIVGGWLTVARAGFENIEAPDPSYLIKGDRAGDVIQARLNTRVVED